MNNKLGNLNCCNKQLHQYLLLYLLYPQIVGTVSPLFTERLAEVRYPAGSGLTSILIEKAPEQSGDTD